MKKEEYEFVAHDKLKHIHIFLNQITYRAFHLHNDFELFCVIAGKGTIHTRNSSLAVRRGSVILLNSNEAHEIDAGGSDLVAIILQFSNHFLREYYYNIRNIIFDQSNVILLLPEAEKKELWRMIRHAAVAYVDADPFFELDCVAALAKILLLLLRFVPHKILSETEYLQRQKLTERINRIFSYLEENYQMPIRLRDVAAVENITPTHFSHFFSETFGITFQEYLNSIRFEHAVRLLESSSLSLSDVAVSSGFSELKYMTKMFDKKLCCKPAEFRDQVCVHPISDSPARTVGVLEYRYPPEESRKILKEIKMEP